MKKKVFGFAALMLLFPTLALAQDAALCQRYAERAAQRIPADSNAFRRWIEGEGHWEELTSRMGTVASWVRAHSREVLTNPSIQNALLLIRNQAGTEHGAYQACVDSLSMGLRELMTAVAMPEDTYFSCDPLRDQPLAITARVVLHGSSFALYLNVNAETGSSSYALQWAEDALEERPWPSFASMLSLSNDHDSWRQLVSRRGIARVARTELIENARFVDSGVERQHFARTCAPTW